MRLPPADLLACSDDQPDAALLARFLDHRDERAFAGLVRRHGPMVLGVCRRVLGDVHAAEDAFQATFLVLVRRAAGIRRAHLGPWLYGVARRTALKARTINLRRAIREQTAAATRPRQHEPVEVADPQLGPALDEELSRLPEALRTAVVLCDLEGLSRRQAARVLGCAESTLSGRLTLARERLARRLTRRGVIPVFAGLVAAVPPSLARATCSAAVVGTGNASASVLAPVSRLTDEVIRTMTLTRTFATTGLVAAATLLITTAVIFAEPEPAPASPAPAAAKMTAPADEPNPVAKPRLPAPGDWPLFRGNALMTGVGQAKLPAQLQERWAFKTGDAVEGAPVVAGGVVYVGSFDKHLYAIDLTTGKQKWKTKLGPIKASPSVRGDKVYVGNLDGKFFCLAAADGKPVWEFETGGEITSGCNFHGDTILIGSHDSTLYCLDGTGKKLWEVKTDGPVNGSPVVVGDTTFVAGCDSVLHVLDAKSGKELGTVDLGGQAAATAAVSGDFAYVGTMANQVVGIDWKNKKKAWAFEAAKRQQPFYASAVVTDALVVAGSRDQKVYGIDRKTGTEVWSFETDGMVDGSPVVVGDKVYVGCLSKDGLFYVLDLKTGKKLQELDLDSAVTGSVAVGPDCVLVGTDKGTMYCLGAR